MGTGRLIFDTDRMMSKRLGSGDFSHGNACGTLYEIWYILKVSTNLCNIDRMK
jgi:hypothetical protein